MNAKARLRVAVGPHVLTNQKCSVPAVKLRASDTSECVECFECFPSYHYVITHEKGVWGKRLNLSSERNSEFVREAPARVRDEPIGAMEREKKKKKQWCS